jgi:predicted RNA-binding protein YlxR (DUF448 family)
VTDFGRQTAESPQSWLTRLAGLDEGELPPAQRRARAAYLAEARRLCQEEQQREKWRRKQE